MKLYKILLLIFLLSCNNQNKTTLYDDLSTDSIQEYTVSSRKDTVLELIKGTRLIIPSNSFSTNEDFVHLRIDEVYDKSDFIIKNLSTISNSHILESSGMIRLSAFDKKRNHLSLKDSSSITIKFKRQVRANEMQKFIGFYNERNIVEWNNTNDFFRDTIVMKKEEIFLMERGGDSVVVEVSTIIGNDTILGNPFALEIDTIIEPGVEILNEYSADSYDVAIDSIEFFAPANKDFYIFNITSLGWINCDRFLEKDNLTDLSVKVNSNQDSEAFDLFIIFQNYNSIMLYLFKTEKAYKFINVPSNEPVVILAMKKTNEEYYFGKQEVQTSNKQVNIDVHQIELEKLKSELRKLDRSI